jgi:anti-anti-sigma factor
VAAGGRTLLRVSGPLNGVTTPALAAALRPYHQDGVWLILDVRAVEYIETPGLRLLLALADELPARGGRMRLVVLPGSRVERTLRLSGLDPRCPVFPTAREAWAERLPGETHPAGRPREWPDKDRREREISRKREPFGRKREPVLVKEESQIPSEPLAVPFRVLRPFAFSRSLRSFPDHSGGTAEEGDDHDTG